SRTERAVTRAGQHADMRLFVGEEGLQGVVELLVHERCERIDLGVVHGEHPNVVLTFIDNGHVTAPDAERAKTQEEALNFLRRISVLTMAVVDAMMRMLATAATVGCSSRRTSAQIFMGNVSLLERRNSAMINSSNDTKKHRVAPATMDGSRLGSVAETNARTGPAPSTLAALSILRSTFFRAEPTIRMMKGKVTAACAPATTYSLSVNPVFTASTNTPTARKI